jgi:hypothetical protein
VNILQLQQKPSKIQNKYGKDELNAAVRTNISSFILLSAPMRLNLFLSENIHCAAR